MEPPTYLAEKNPHPRDKCITFDEGPHIYTINGDSDFMSVTTWNHSHFDHFDADKIIDKMIMGRKWGPAHKHWGKTKLRTRHSSGRKLRTVIRGQSTSLLSPS